MTSKQLTLGELQQRDSDVELREITTHIVDSEHKSAPESEQGYPYVKTSDIENGRINFEDVSYVDEDAYEEWTRRLVPEPGDIIFTREAPVGRVGIIPDNKEVCLGQRTVLIRPNPALVDRHYLRYLLLSDDIQNRFQALSTGSTVDHLNLSDLRSFELPTLPDLDDQRKIGFMLKAIDDKIQLNEVLIEKLDIISQNIYRDRFVDFSHYDDFKTSNLGDIPVEFEVSKVGDLVWSGRGYSYTSDHLDKENELEESYPMVNLKNVREGGGFNPDGFKYYTEESIKDRYHVEVGDLVIAITEQTQDGSLIGSPTLIPSIDAERTIISQDLAKIVPHEIPRTFLFHVFNSKEFDAYSTSVATGTTVYHLSLTSIEEFELPLPPSDEIQRFTEIVQPMHEKQRVLLEQNEILENLKDELLPKLLDGEIRVQDINFHEMDGLVEA